MRIKVQTLKTLLWLLIAVAFAAILGLLVYIFMRVVPIIKDTNKARARGIEKSIKTALAVSPTIKARERSTGLNWSDYENLRNLNVTGKEPPKVEDPTASATPKSLDLKKVEEVLSIKYIVSGNTANDSAVAIKYKDEPDTPPPPPPPAGGSATVSSGPAPVRILEGFLRVGDSLKTPYNAAPYNGKVLNIYDYGAELSWGDGKVIVLPTEMPKNRDPVKKMWDNGGAGSGVDVVGDSATRVQRNKESKPLDDKSDNDWYIGTDELARFDTEGEALLGEIELGVTMVKSENRQRLALKKVPEGSLAYQRGFREEDVLRSINGEEMSSKSAIVDYFKNNQQLTSYKIEIERRGSKLTKTFRVAR